MLENQARSLPMAHDPYDLSVRDVVELLSVHPDTVVRWANDGALPCLRTPGKHRRFRRSDIEQFIAAQSAPLAPAEPTDAA